ncbi:activity-regulated cytoskeleton associated protein 1-like [Musca vetustissima]|uniref:activity-regulated cytoskeleton associated protein 1-like n=1 Tax=Musca vetustissima TaxID=27455 RepID=UPI002AB75A0E|nr:activity-regulated cytoskeleton associated protein 1-like [Musca vetustissima]
MPQMVQKTTEQLQQLIEAVRISTANSAAQAAENIQQKSKGSFCNCPSRFGGQRDHEAVEEFITSIVTYKEIECISDEDALKSISLLLVSTWWQGVRKEAKTWNDVLALIGVHIICVVIPQNRVENAKRPKNKIMLTTTNTTQIMSYTTRNGIN